MKLVVALCFVYIGINAALYAFQRSLQYFPDPALVHPDQAGLTNFTTVRFVAEDGIELAGWYAAARADAPTIVYFQGNAQGIAARAERFDLFNKHGYGVLALGYRGYSGSQGKPTEVGLLHDGRAAIAYLGRQGVPASKLVFYGESLGSGVAVRLASDAASRPGAVILEAPFTSAADVAKMQYWFVPVALLMKDQFRSIDHIPQVSSPVFIMHGDADRVVPFEHGRKLFDAIVSAKEFLAVPGGGHIDDLTMPIWQRMHDFVTSHLDSH